jgi:3-phosphoglycerate kinase
VAHLLPAVAGLLMERELDALAGTWSQQEAECFQAAIAPLWQVDPDLWR